MPLLQQTKSDVQEMLALLKDHTSNDPQVIKALKENQSQFDPTLGDPQNYLLAELEKAKNAVDAEDHYAGETFRSRNRLAALAQAHLSTENQLATPVEHGSFGDAMPAVTDVFGEGNPIVWAPVMINILLEHLKGKADFKTATDAGSFIKISPVCRIALLGDWGADNNHAQRIADLVRNHQADIVIHLGDIYYAGNEYESERFLANWPVKIEGHNSFALNGNHEMYSRGIPYFNTVLKSFNQEASYFTLYNDDWQLHGLDTAYVPFSIDGSVPTDKPSFFKKLFDRVGKLLPFESHENFDAKPDSRLQTQWKWLSDKLAEHPSKKNIFLSHNQPVSAYLPEFQAGSFLDEQYRRLIQPIRSNAVFAWFFGHEHKGTIYNDSRTDFKARLIGNGAIPHSRQALVPAAKDERNASCTPVFTMNNKALASDLLDVHELDLAVSTFALLTLDGPNANVEYINEDGTLFLKEKLSGGPNEVIQWGDGYKPLDA